MKGGANFRGEPVLYWSLGRRTAGRLPRSLGVLFLALSLVRASTTHPKQFNDFFTFQKLLHFFSFYTNLSKNRKNCLIV